MGNQKGQRWKGTLCLLLALAIVPILFACEAAGDNAPKGPIIASEARSQGTATDTTDPKDAFQTRLAVTRAAMFTRSALTGTLPNPGPPPTQPTYPPAVGVFWADVFLNRMTHGHQVRNYWQGWVDRRLVQAQAGYKVDVNNLQDEPQPLQGVIVIIRSESDPGEYFETPDRVGEIEITSARGTVLAVATLDDQHAYTFDLQTHQWQIATPEPLPAIWTPIPSQSLTADTPTESQPRASGVATATPNSKEAFSTRVTATLRAERTSIALTGVPTWTPGAPPPYTGPTMTPALGIFGGEPPTNNANQQRITSAWRGWVDGQILTVSAGNEGPADEPTQGFVELFDEGSSISQFYRAPQKVGALVVKSENNNQLTLVSEDGLSTYLFDLSTRKWIDKPSQALTAIARPTSTEVSLRGMYIPRGGLEPSAVKIYSRWSRGFPEGWLDDGSDPPAPPMSVEAGSEGMGGDAQQGLISVTVWRQGTALYRTPTRSGPIRISDKVGDVIDFVTEDGTQTVTFDLNSRTWVAPISK